MSCNARHIGETGRSLETRLKEHKASVRLGKSDVSALADHANSQGHDIEWDETIILTKQSHWLKRKLTEAWCIAKEKNALTNRDCGRKLPDNYRTLVSTK